MRLFHDLQATVAQCLQEHHATVLGIVFNFIMRTLCVCLANIAQLSHKYCATCVQT